MEGEGCKQRTPGGEGGSSPGHQAVKKELTLDIGDELGGWSVGGGEAGRNGQPDNEGSDLYCICFR